MSEEIKNIHPNDITSESSDVEENKETKKSKSIVRRIFTILGYILFFYVAIYVFVNAFTSDQTTIKYFGYKSFIVQTHSMNPVYKRGDIVFVTKAEAGKLQEGDVITFKTIGQTNFVDENGNPIKINNLIVTHYIAEISFDEEQGTYLYKTMANQITKDGVVFENWQQHLSYKQGKTTEDGRYDIWYESADPKSTEVTLYITHDQIIGKVSGAIPKLGHVGLFLSERLRLNDPVLIVLIVINILIIYLIFKIIFGETKERSEEKKQLASKESEPLQVEVEVVEKEKARGDDSNKPTVEHEEAGEK